jgi:hypothetical protein
LAVAGGDAKMRDPALGTFGLEIVFHMFCM